MATSLSTAPPSQPAEAYAEKSPVVVISGAPGMKEREKNPLLHHKVREFDTQKKVFEQLTVASTVLSDLLPWSYHRVPDVLGAGYGFIVETEADLEHALLEAQRKNDAFCLLDVRLDPLDRSPALQRLGQRLAAKV